MTDFMDTAWTKRAGEWIAPKAKRCDVCAQFIYEGHIDCTCDKNHPDPCDRPTYDQLGEHLRRIAGDNMDFAMRYRKVLQGLLDKGTLSPIDAAEIDAALSWVGD
jgi:hypothetical protein